MSRKARVKICGIRTPEVYRFCAELHVDYFGLMLVRKSPRYIPVDQAKALCAIPLIENEKKPKIVVVTVDADDRLLDQIAEEIKPDYLQLHGAETPERIDMLKQRFPMGIIKAISVETQEDLAKVYEYPTVDMFLFDAKPPKGSVLTGGNAISFDWSIMQNFHCNRPWFLAGGLHSENLQTALHQSGAKLIDLSSGVESEKGVKSIAKIRALMSLLS